MEGRPTLLLVEDDERLRKGFVSLLTHHGYEVLVAISAREALRICQSHPGTIHLLLTDVVMPEMNGFELAQEARSFRSALRVLYMSGYTSDTLKASPAPPGEPLELIQKPFDSRSLLARVQELLASSPPRPK